MSKLSFCILTVFILNFLMPQGSEAALSSQSDVTSGPNGPHPYLRKGLSSKKLIETARDHQWSINFKRKNLIDTINIVALRVEFAKDTSALTTGNGTFGITIVKGDPDETTNYDTNAYKYDRLPHDSSYFAAQLEMVKNYYKKVSHGKLILKSTIYPSLRDEGYAVSKPITFYSPGYKKKKESWDEYYNRKTYGLVLFIKDALEAAAKSPNSPFVNLTFNASDSTFRDELGHKTVFLIFHAGASYLTNGGDGTDYNDTPSDMIDAFVDKEFFKQYRDTLELTSDGITVQGKNGQITLDEIMMCSETSNQDRLNWGIQGILVNQIARQIGIPDLFSTSSGITGVGAFCIMDFYGYSAGKGFIPPYPSAWVRAFMGWDNIKIASLGDKAQYSVKAITSIIDRDSSLANAASDTSILLIPINDHEYYLIENRQRNLSSTQNVFKFDTIDDNVVIAAYPDNINLDSNVVTTTGRNHSNVIQKVKNNDVSLPASGILVWHIDEHIIKSRLKYNLVNADSLYKGISLVEADGVNDLGITFQNMFYDAIYDVGGAEDVFPHTTRIGSGITAKVDSLGPYTLPSTRSNDGGQTYISMKIKPESLNPAKEQLHLVRGENDHFITNFSDSIFNIHVTWDYLSASWPKRAVPDSFYDPVACDIDPSQKGKELVLLGKSGYVYIWPSDQSATVYNKRSVTIDRTDLNGNVVPSIDTIAYYDSIPGVYTMPTFVNSSVYIPAKQGSMYILSSSADGGFSLDSISLPLLPSTYLCNYADSSWAIGTEDGSIIFGASNNITKTLKLKSDSAVTAIASLRETGNIAVIQKNGRLSVCSKDASNPDTSVVISSGIGPFTLITGDIDKDSSSEIIVADSRHGLWVFKRDLTLAPGWEKEPNDWCNAYAYTMDKKNQNRLLYPVNNAAASLGDINKDGYLDILIGGTNGIYAFNYKGVLINKWPAYLDKKYWYQRQSVTTTPLVLTGKNREPLVLFASSTGENVTFSINNIIKADKQKGIVWYTRDDGVTDSIWDLSSSEIDTMLTLGDSLILPYVMPGGLIDALNANAKRPVSVLLNTLQSSWPLTTGGSIKISPLVDLIDTNKTPDLVAVSSSGWIYKWELAKEILPDTLFWSQNGFDAGRSFSYKGNFLPQLTSESDPVSLYSYPNPAANIDKVIFRYKFNAAATKVRLDIFSYTGFCVYSKTSMGNAPHDLTGSYPDWNEHLVDIKKFGPAVYRCRMEATINGKKHSTYWKMAVVK